MSNRRASKRPAKSPSAHPALIALARLLGRQAALDAIRTGALRDDPKKPREAFTTGFGGTEEQDSQQGANTPAEAGRGRSLSRNLEEDADAPRGSRRGPRKAGK